MLVTYSVLTIKPCLADLLDLVAVGGLLEAVLMAVFFEAQGDTVAFEEEYVPFTHDGSCLF
jgi:hypothetical protein